MTDHWRAVQCDDQQPLAEIPDPRVVHISERFGRSAAPPAAGLAGSAQDGGAHDARSPHAGVPAQIGGPVMEARRGFLRRTVGYLAADARVRQFVDLGSRLPAGDGIGRAAREYAPGSRVVYVDAESTAALHGGRAAAEDTAVSVVAVAHMDPHALIDRLIGRGVIDFADPVGVLVTDTTALRRDGVLVHDLVRALHMRMGPGGHVAIAQPASDSRDPHCREFAASVFEPFTLVEPGLTDMAWWPYPDEEVSGEPTGILAGLGRRG
ncbi:SAM-dependent methyltransferase [Streptomonospora litoralis]|uniref:S-adenosyl methyltransferase n=1 Tax=Streptomonospora litoralis TaxID=2498135 RepID=A0A4P6Q522_9ACTN|nr:SAM-dependent methyltransferase [Streptomonospora litoralis]QBI53847.1 S-adenosyl methyltransferase [Streptomonospora litoralis]